MSGNLTTAKRACVPRSTASQPIARFGTPSDSDAARGPGWPLLSLILLTCLTAGCRSACHQPACYLEMPRELEKTTLPEYVIEPPDVLVIESSESLPGRPAAGERLVRSDGTILIPSYGEVFVVGMTPKQAERAIADLLERHLTTRPQISVDVAAYNSKFYYVMGEVARPGRYPVTGNETVLDALSLAGGPSPYAHMRKVLLVRPTSAATERHAPELSELIAMSQQSESCCDLGEDLAGGRVFEVDLRAIAECGDTATNYQIRPGDRIVVKPMPAVALDRRIGPVLNHIERALSIGVLGDVLFGNGQNGGR